MDFDKALRELYEERKRLDRAIARIESSLLMFSDPPKKSPRGRKSMGPEERLQVSARMTAYWAARRARAAPKESSASASDSPNFPGNGIIV